MVHLPGEGVISGSILAVTFFADHSDLMASYGEVKLWLHVLFTMSRPCSKPPLFTQASLDETFSKI